MQSVLLCSAPLTGHVQPMLAIGRRLVESGTDVTILTGRKFRERAERSGIRFQPLPSTCDYDESRLDDHFPGRGRRPAFLRSRFDAEHMFAAPLAEQYRAIDEAIDAFDVDLVLAENLFMGTLPLVERPVSDRPKVFAVCTSPLMATSVDTAPFGPGLPPAASGLRKTVNGLLNTGARKLVLRRAQQVADAGTRSVTGRGAATFLLDWPLLADKVFVLTTPGFEYPRSDIGDRLSFVGPILPPAPADSAVPPWWTRLDTDRPVVLVTQGTLDNDDLSRLIEPTIDALAGQDVLIVATTGGRPVDAVRRNAPNLIVSEFVPFDLLLPRVDVMVTNGGWGGVHFALAHGVPIVVAGSTEDKAEVGARLERAGAGLRIRSGRPSSAVLGRAIDEVISNSHYRSRAEELQRELGELDSLDAISRQVDARTT
ncbi:glycosyltransferase [Rhodococcus triatomae]|uniref:Glycosyltransferase, MGT family n=1 Tax=Rhodococcus triatomae TaxID=300028 RepID=A0A1G8M8K5_9NOCA|nr:nucleotide disphospho-sugar-binding domain-containing protein [Rhodococcus triatomae]QNG18165.1 glycosyltransferase [Rhodococcus triatomae]QNG22165.1 glycosyltransferase [Rhodococcus triatomae]SDI64183.1 glycosyltransferase, MGT family [Rhodococcus triatomae]